MLESKIGIISSGGPAPGINNVIHAVTLEAHKRGLKTVGVVKGFRGVMENADSNYMDLDSKITAQFSNQGGCVLGMTRFNPFTSEDKIKEFIKNLKERAITSLIVIGGEGSAFLSHKFSSYTDEIKLIHVPKTIDNDLLLPCNFPTFGFETARYAGANTVTTLVLDARTCSRWFIVTCMGRRAGFLALNIGLAGGATLTLVPEEFPKDKFSIDDVVSQIANAIDQRTKKGKNYGVVILAEGIIDNINSVGCKQLESCTRDEIGRIRYADFDIGELVLPKIREIFKQNNSALTINTKNLGYELRCHDPLPFDIAYTKFLGFGAVEFLAQGKTGVVVVWDGENLKAIPLKDMADESGKIRSKRSENHSGRSRLE